MLCDQQKISFFSTELILVVVYETNYYKLFEYNVKTMSYFYKPFNLVLEVGHDSSETYILIFFS